MSDFPEILKALRTQRKWSQSDLAERLNISKSTVSMYEQGLREPNFKTLNMLADIFQVDLDYLIGRKDMSSGQHVPNTIAAHLDTYGLTDEELEDIADYIKYIRSKRKS